MDITIIGTGYVGLVAAACLADMGNNVICVDKDNAKLEQLKNGIMPIYEPELEELVKTNTIKNRLSFTDDINIAVKKSEICFIAVDTPQKNDGGADLSSVFEVAKDIAKAMNGYKIVVNKSTAPVGTLDKISKIIKENTKFDFDVVVNPEFLKQGNAVKDFLSPDRIIIGSNSKRAIEIMQNIYSPFFRTGNRIVIMDIKSAEMTKYASNAFLAAKISFMNEVANLCEKVGADVEKVRLGMSMDNRIGNKFLFSGLGFGGSCFPKDINALIKTGEENNCKMKIIRAVKEVNEEQKEIFLDKIIKRFGKNLEGKTFAVWGLAFKPKTNDIRKAPSVIIIKKLLEIGAKLQVFDPQAIEEAKKIFADRIIYTGSSYEALNNADCLLLLTEWNEFRNPDFDKMKTLLKTPIIFDGRNQYTDINLKEKGFEYYRIGKSSYD